MSLKADENILTGVHVGSKQPALTAADHGLTPDQLKVCMFKSSVWPFDAQMDGV